MTTVLTAALELLLSEGGAALTPLRLHQATGVSRSTIYRHWATPTDVLAALIEVAPPVQRTLSGDLVADLHAEVDLLCDRLRDRPVSAFLQALVTMAASDPAAVPLRQRYVNDLVAPFRAVLSSDTAADTAADAPANPAADTVADTAADDHADDAVNAIVAPLLLDALLLDRAADRARAHRAVDLYFPAS